MTHPFEIVDAVIWIAVPTLLSFTLAGRRFYREHMVFALLIWAVFVAAAVFHILRSFRT